MVQALWKKLKQQMAREPADEPLVTFMQVAREDPTIKRFLVGILSQDEFHRASILNTTIEEMQLKGAPQSLISSLASLLDKEVAERAYRLLKNGA